MIITRKINRPVNSSSSASRLPRILGFRTNRTHPRLHGPVIVRFIRTSKGRIVRPSPVSTLTVFLTFLFTEAHVMVPQSPSGSRLPFFLGIQFGL